MSCHRRFETSATKKPLWNALRNRLISTVATDHAPFDFEDQKRRLGADDFTKIPNGIPSRRRPHQPAIHTRCDNWKDRSKHVRRLWKHSSCQVIRPLPEEGRDRCRQRCRSRDLRSGTHRQDLSRDAANERSTIAASRAGRSRAALQLSPYAVRSKPATASSLALSAAVNS